MSVFVILALIGALKTGSVLFGWQIQNLPILAWIHQSILDFAGLLGRYVPAVVLRVVWWTVPLVLALALVVILWRRARD